VDRHRLFLPEGLGGGLRPARASGVLQKFLLKAVRAVARGRAAAAGSCASRGCARRNAMSEVRKSRDIEQECRGGIGYSADEHEAEKAAVSRDRMALFLVPAW